MLFHRISWWAQNLRHYKNYLCHHSFSASASFLQLPRIAVVSSSDGQPPCLPDPYCWHGSLYRVALLRCRRCRDTIPTSLHNCGQHGPKPSQYSSYEAEQSPWPGYRQSFFSLGLYLPLRCLLDSIRHGLGHHTHLEWLLLFCCFCNSSFI